jgi:hypothetical protein
MLSEIVFQKLFLEEHYGLDLPSVIVHRERELSFMFIGIQKY